VAHATLPRPAAAWPRARPGAQSPASAAEEAPRFVYLLLLVFIVLEYVRPPVVSHMKIQMLTVIIVPLLWLTSAQRLWTPVLTYQALFVAWCVKSLPIAYNYFSVYVSTRLMFGYFAVSIALVWVGSNLRELRRLLWLWMVVMTYQAIYAITHGGRGSGGILGDENDLALAMTSALPIALAGAERLRGGVRWVLLGMAALMLTAIVVSFSRGGFIGLVLSIAYLLFASRHRLRNAALILAGGLLLFALAPQSYIDELRTIQDTDEGTAKGRKFLWTAAFNMWLANPVLGVGASNASFLVGRYQPTNFEGREYHERDWSGTVLHSAWFTLLAEHGIVGVLLFAAMITHQFRCVRRLRRDVRARDDVPDALAREVETFGVGLNSALVAYIGSGAFLSVLYYPYLWYFTALTSALDIAVRRELAGLSAAAAPAAPATADA
jgi:O-antigen ligase